MNCGKTIFLTTAVWLGATTVSPARPQSEPDITVRKVPSVATANVAHLASSSKGAGALRSTRTEDENYTETRLGTSCLTELSLRRCDLVATPPKLRVCAAACLR